MLSEDKAIEFLMSVKTEAIKAAFGICALPEKELFQRLEMLYMNGVDAGVKLGAERARVVKPLVWEDSEECSICRPHGYQAYDDGVATIAEAKTLIERDHIAHVLSMLEPV